jgi:hypothetical protein
MMKVEEANDDHPAVNLTEFNFQAHPAEGFDGTAARSDRPEY